MTDYDPRIVALYDDDNPDGPDHDFYRALADEREARAVLDIGCGTGMLTVSLARDERSVVGVDPSPSMLQFARGRDGATAVTWVLGDSSGIPDGVYDYAVMTGNVAQHIPETHWSRTLRDIRAHMDPGATLAFESRNPLARAWESWAAAEKTSRLTANGTLAEWNEAKLLDAQTVELVSHNHFIDSDEVVTERAHLAFRSREQIERDLADAGFEIESVFSDWHRTPFHKEAPLMVFVARAAELGEPVERRGLFERRTRW
ncbi:class I SAM-dependent methyltransferase [Humidisolicoccus flavus]|uniref:class I SAM-dependent methyltransferase n=1 Tax=Humidisolicoccus flavus TaxID=3111414 RepID=UPI0032558A05